MLDFALSPAEVLLVVEEAVAAVAGALAVAGRVCTSQWNGSKLEFGSTQDGFLDA